MRDFEGMSKKHFDAQAEDYDRKETVYYSKFPKISCHDVAAQLRLHPYDRLLDVGCGTGFLIDLLKSQKDAEYYGLDLSPEMIRVARSKLDDSVHLTEGSANRLPYPDGTFDVVCCVQSFHHYPYPEQAMEEVYRVLKPDGLYILSDTGCNGLAKHFDNFFFRYFMRSGDYAAYSRKDIETRMAKSGFSIRSSRRVSGFIFTVIGQKKGE